MLELGMLAAESLLLSLLCYILESQSVNMSFCAVVCGVLALSPGK